MQTGPSYSVIQFNSRCPYHTRRCKCSARRESTKPPSRDAHVRLLKPPNTTWSLKDLEAKQHWQLFALPDFKSWGPLGFWDSVLPRHAESNPVVRAQFVALSIAHREASGSRRLTPAVLASYGRALRSLREYTQSPDRSNHVALIASTVIHSVSRMLGDKFPPHLEYALRLLFDEHHSKNDATSSIREERRIMRQRIGTMAFLQACQGHSFPLLSECGFDMPGDMSKLSDAGTTLSELQQALFAVAINVAVLLNAKQGRETLASRLASSLADWKRAATAWALGNSSQLSADVEIGWRFYGALMQHWYGTQLLKDMEHGKDRKAHSLHELVVIVERLLIALRGRESKQKWRPKGEMESNYWPMHLKMILVYAWERSCCAPVRDSLQSAMECPL